MKKMLSFISALTMCAVMAAPIVSSAADGESQPTTKTVEQTLSVGYEIKASEEETSATESKVVVAKGVDNSYTVVIPAGTANLADEATLTVSATENLIGGNEVLDVTVSSKNNWELKNDYDRSLAYKLLTIKDGEEVVLSRSGEAVSVLTLNAEKTGSTEMTAEVTGTPTMAGLYTDTLTFTVDVKTVGTTNADGGGSGNGGSTNSGSQDPENEEPKTEETTEPEGE